MAAIIDPSVKVGSQIGRSVLRVEGRDKVTGRAEYTHTMRLPGMLHAKLFRSTVPHGKIKSVDTRAAEKLPGVLHVVTIDHVKRVIPNPTMARHFMISLFLRTKRCALSASPSQLYWQGTHMWPIRRCNSLLPNMKHCPPSMMKLML